MDAQDVKPQPALALWRENRDEVLNARAPDKAQYDQFIIGEAKKLLARIPTGKKILKWVEDNSVDILMDHQVKDCRGYILPGTNTICVTRHDDPLAVAVVIAHEARHIWQDKNGLIATVFDTPSEIAAKTRLIEADAYATELRVLYEFEKSSLPVKPEPGLENLKYMMRVDQNAENNGELMWAGFYAFFDGRRKNLFDASSAVMCMIGLRRLLRPDEKDLFNTLSGDFMPRAGFQAAPNEGVPLTVDGLLKLSRGFDEKDPPYLQKAATFIIENQSQFMGQFSKIARRRMKTARNMKRILAKNSGRTGATPFPFY